jgi:hypothetical protein
MLHDTRRRDRKMICFTAFAPIALVLAGLAVLLLAFPNGSQPAVTLDIAELNAGK